MDQCSRCNKPCAPNALLCNECQNQLRGQFRRVNTPERVVDRLSEAAQRIAKEEQAEFIQHKRPRASRLAPIRDISADIQRESTPLSSLVDTKDLQAAPSEPPLRSQSAMDLNALSSARLRAPTSNSIPSTDLPVGTWEVRNSVGSLMSAPEYLDIDDNTPEFPNTPSGPPPIPSLRPAETESRHDSVVLPFEPAETKSRHGSVVAGSHFKPAGRFQEPPDRSVSDPQSDQDLAVGTGEERRGEGGLVPVLPDLWPWLLEADPEENETDSWANRTDPLMLRHFPSSDEAARIEEEDIRRAMAEGALAERSGASINTSVPVLKSRRKRSSPMRIIFIVLAILAVLALIIDGVLISATLLRPHRTPNDSNGPPSLTVSQPTASIGGKITARISHFHPSTKVLLTHDIEEPVQTTTGHSLIQLDSSGNASAIILIDASWGPGFHTLEAEDVTTRYTASAQLQIVNAGQTRPSHLLINSDITSLNLGADYQGTNTIQMLTLRNSGDGTPISWTASTNKPWLMVSPPQGIFSESQVLSVAVDRVNLKPGNYTDGLITISSNVGPPVSIKVQMSVKPLPANPGPVLAVTPAVLSFSATDGGTNPTAQPLTISNPGSRLLHWTVTANNETSASNTNSLFHSLGVKANWLSASLASGTVLPNGTEQVQVSVNSTSLLPGTYTGTLVFTPVGGAYDKAQTVNVSLTVQQHCGISPSTGSMSFTAVADQSNPGNQALGLSATASCSTPISWTAISSQSWLSVTPSSGYLNGSNGPASAVISVAVNASILAPGNYNGMLAFLTGQSTQSVAVQLTVQPKPVAAAPIIAVSGLTLNFSNTQGQANPPSQVVTITNNGQSTLYWNVSAQQDVARWLGYAPSGGEILPGKAGQLSVNINTSSLSPGTYVGQLTLNGRDVNGNPASGSPQTITVNVLVLPPCTLAQPSSSSLVFNAAPAGANPAPQTVQFTATGNCGWPLTLHASVSEGASWLRISPSSGSIAVSGQPVSISVAPDITDLKAASAPYTAQVTLTATDSAGVQAQGSPQAFSISLNIVQPAQPCQLNVSTTSLTFSEPNAAAQTVSIGESGNCALPISWTAVGDDTSTSWLGLSPTSGSDAGTTSPLTVSVNPTNQSAGTHTGKITISAQDAGGNQLQGSGQTVTVTLTIPGYSISGSVVACSDTACTNSSPLPGATLTVLNALSVQVATVMADSSGSYQLASLAPGTYTVNVSGTDSNGNLYTGTSPLTVTGDQANCIMKAY